LRKKAKRSNQKIDSMYLDIIKRTNKKFAISPMPDIEEKTQNSTILNDHNENISAYNDITLIKEGNEKNKRANSVSMSDKNKNLVNNGYRRRIIKQAGH
jgi:hypothetical protein